MTLRNLEFSMRQNLAFVPVKVRVFDTDKFGVWATLDGGIFNGCELNYSDVKGLISMLEQIQGHIGDIANGAKT